MKRISLLRTVCLTVGLSAAFLYTSCDYGPGQILDHGDSVEERAEEMLDLEGNDVPNISSGATYSFIAVTDTHFGNSDYGRHETEFFAKVKEVMSSYNDAGKPIKFAVCLGDVADHGWKGEFEDYKDFMDTLGGIISSKVYTAVGNHDLFNNGWDDYEDIVWPYTSFYRFKVGGNFTFYFTDTGSGSMGPAQFKILKKTMEKDDRYKILCSHYPVYATDEFFWNYFSLQNTQETDSLIKLCNKEKVVLSLAGHIHSDHSNSEKLLGFKEQVIAAHFSNRVFLVVTVDDSKGTTEEHRFTY